MNRLLLFLGAATLLVNLALPVAALACPNCQDAIASAANAGGEDPLREPRAYNHSIYLMAGMPYLLLGFLGVMIYRTARKSTSNLHAPAEIQEDPEGIETH
jgi:hypothetical protein